MLWSSTFVLLVVFHTSMTRKSTALAVISLIHIDYSMRNIETTIIMLLMPMKKKARNGNKGATY
jgi:hypothetical protein